MFILTWVFTGSRRTVRDVVEAISPGRMEAMLGKRLHRRQYTNRGPNFAWHVDGNDKLRPFGFSIHGAIDGWSRKILWLHCGISNKDPNIICNYYMDQVESLGILPVLICVDPGTENGHMADVHTLLRDENNDTFSNRPVRTGSSVHNQRIERWWGYLRQSFTNFYMNLFKDLRDSGIVNMGDAQHVACLQFCFSKLIQKELNQIKDHWNLHDVRYQKNVCGPHGKPEYLYNNPEVWGAENAGLPVNRNRLDICRQLIPQRLRNPYGCSDEFAEMALQYMLDTQKRLPENVYEALDLCGDLITFLAD